MSPLTRRLGSNTERSVGESRVREDVIAKLAEIKVAGVAHFAALASAETELSELFEMYKVSEWANELALSCKIAVRRG